jgi:hypothetical protein
MQFLQPVHVPDRIFLKEVLFWVAFQRLPQADFNEDGQEIHDAELSAWIAPLNRESLDSAHIRGTHVPSGGAVHSINSRLNRFC